MLAEVFAASSNSRRLSTISPITIIAGAVKFAALASLAICARLETSTCWSAKVADAIYHDLAGWFQSP